MLNLLTKDNIDKQLGSSKWTDISLTITNYIGGVIAYEGLDIGITSFDYKEKGLLITSYVGFKRVYTGMLHERIAYWDISENDYDTIKEKKSVIKRALLGGLLLGPAGAIVGGMSGLKDAETKAYKDKHPYTLMIRSIFNDNNIIGEWYLSSKEYKMATLFFTKYYPEKNLMNL